MDKLAKKWDTFDVSYQITFPFLGKQNVMVARPRSGLTGQEQTPVLFLMPYECLYSFFTCCFYRKMLLSALVSQTLLGSRAHCVMSLQVMLPLK